MNKAGWFLILIAVLYFGGHMLRAQDFKAGVFPSIGDGYLFQSVVTDSVVWNIVAVDSANLGDSTCVHEWEYSKVSNYGSDNMISCAVYHAGFHCGWNDGQKTRICARCLRKEDMRETWYQHRYTPPPTKYDSLNARLK